MFNGDQGLFDVPQRKRRSDFWCHKDVGNAALLENGSKRQSGTLKVVGS
jgi:hypothetical protein